ncbi:MAG: hypothetical protein WAO45_05965 [Tissierellaceae bacterium]
MKKIINNPNEVVEEMLQGMVAAHPEYIKRVEGFDVIVRKDSPIKGKVGLVSVGGSIMMLTKDTTNLSVVDQIRNMLRFAKSQKYYPYKYRDEWS